ncbi:MAG: undecaprenyldiphospho-muramoylpentapeptide beta-N-acetylglucosaminyltransferase [Desulfobacterales bacterium]|jgi:UDP-N-acetylglucosamine--N-acetylmuramyl-(pentapeptide) pyrophosphoryl-undecaprenol N-acetylglucosamine transferase
MRQVENSESNGPSARPLRIAFAGGGTGGHLFPGIAIAQEFLIRNPANKIIFMSTGNSLERSVLGKAGFELKEITAAAIKGRGFWNQINSISKIPKGILQSLRILKMFAPDITIGLGSYSAGPVVIGAWFMKITIVLHEQNILPGITNKILARFASRIYVSFKNTGGGLDPTKVHWTGNPIRMEIIECSSGEDSASSGNSRSGFFTVLIIGGSQGAHSINIAIIDALEHLAHKNRLYFIHQTGLADERSVREAYQRYQISNTSKAFFDNMAELYRDADLVICRAGATTVAEITAIGKAAIFIPYPFAADNHQVLNAGNLSKDGAAEMILEKDLNAIVLSQMIDYYVAHPAALEKMADKAKQFGNPDAAKNIVDDCYRLLAV